MSEDHINPDHYREGPFECIELCRLLTFDWGNVAKYAYRWQGKNGVEDLRKALWYANDANIRGVPVWADEANFAFGVPLVAALKKSNHAGLAELWGAFGDARRKIIPNILMKKIDEVEANK